MTIAVKKQGTTLHRERSRTKDIRTTRLGRGINNASRTIVIIITRQSYNLAGRLSENQFVIPGNIAGNAPVGIGPEARIRTQGHRALPIHEIQPQGTIGRQGVNKAAHTGNGDGQVDGGEGGGGAGARPDLAIIRHIDHGRIAIVRLIPFQALATIGNIHHASKPTIVAGQKGTAIASVCINHPSAVPRNPIGEGGIAPAIAVNEGGVIGDLARTNGSRNRSAIAHLENTAIYGRAAGKGVDIGNRQGARVVLLKASVTRQGRASERVVFGGVIKRHQSGRKAGTHKGNGERIIARIVNRYGIACTEEIGSKSGAIHPIRGDGQIPDVGHAIAFPCDRVGQTYDAGEPGIDGLPTLTEDHATPEILGIGKISGGTDETAGKGDDGVISVELIIPRSKGAKINNDRSGDREIAIGNAHKVIQRPTRHRGIAEIKEQRAATIQDDVGV